MCDEEHLIENIVCYVNNVGWQKFSDFPTDDEIKNCLGLCKNGNVEIDKETLRWLIAMARYIDYENSLWGDDE